MKRFVLGTVQLGLPYGRLRQSPLMTVEAAFRVLDSAWDLGVRNFDTAEAYGESAARLREWIEERGHAAGVGVVTKCAVGLGGADRRVSAESAGVALSRFDQVGDLTLLTHGAVDADEWDAVREVAARHGAFGGQSVYTAEEVRAACQLPRTSRVQAPGNVIDTRAVSARGESTVPLDVRSVYLQGVLLQAPGSAESRAPGAFRLVTALQAAAAAVRVPLAVALVASVLRMLRVGDRVVLGVDNESQLAVLSRVLEVSDDVIDDFREAARSLTGDVDCEAILDPRRWPMDDAG